MDVRAEGNCYILLRITDVMYRCLKEELIYVEERVDFTFLFVFKGINTLTHT